METQYSIVTLNDHFMVGSATSGHDMVQNMYGMYIRYEQQLQTSKTNLEVSVLAHDKVYKPLIWTSLGWTSTHDPVSVERLMISIEEGSLATNQMLKINRDYKDVLVSTWQLWQPEMSWEEFIASPQGFSSVEAFEKDAAKFTYSLVLSYEDLVNDPHRQFTSIVNHLLPRQDNPELVTFGKAKRNIDLLVIDTVVQDSKIRECREGMSQGLLESVGVWKQFISKTQAEEVDEFLSTL